ncbi:MAG: hypothetical protein LBB59_04735 [Campylobacteraceae bacterium]|jgi:hypothetical protein|nr:hypothetical protein [Campylobacteraceae bacterium]
MNTIKFSHYYDKLNLQKTAELLTIRELTIPDDMNPFLKMYDTRYIIDEEERFYQFKDGKYIQLIFLGNYRVPFCTIRPRYGKYGDKKPYYEGKIGEIFNIVIERGSE